LELDKAQKARRQREEEQAMLDAWAEASCENGMPSIGFVSQTASFNAGRSNTAQPASEDTRRPAR
jgi:hypothetical protein